MLYSLKVPFKTDGEIKTIPFKQRQRELIAINIFKMLKGFLQAEGKYHWIETKTREIHCPQKLTIWYSKDHQTMSWEPNPTR